MEKFIIDLVSNFNKVTFKNTRDGNLCINVINTKDCRFKSAFYTPEFFALTEENIRELALRDNFKEFLK